MRRGDGQVCYNSNVPSPAVFSLVPFIYIASLPLYHQSRFYRSPCIPSAQPTCFFDIANVFSQAATKIECFRRSEVNLPPQPQKKIVIRPHGSRLRNSSAPGWQCARNKQPPFYRALLPFWWSGTLKHTPQRSRSGYLSNVY